MSENDRIILRGHLETRKSEIAPELSEGDFFEVFAAKQKLRLCRSKLSLITE